VNHNLRDVVDSISKNYRYVVIDNEAGIEHLSRRTTRDVEHMLVVTDPTQRGLVAAQRIADLRNELDIRVENAYLIVNRLSGEMPAALQDAVQKLPIPLLGVVPTDRKLMDFEFSGRPLIELGDDSPVYRSVAGMMAQVIE
jgi:CO dehydrogenase maturation factor